MNGALEAKFKPFESPSIRDFSDAKVSDPNAPAKESNSKEKVNFRDVLMNSNDDAARDRVAQKNGDTLRAAKSDEEFAKMMSDKANPDKSRKPQNELDKDAFLKLFVTQMRNQDPLNPDDSAEMAAQLAQFHGLEQMMNVNKNLEKTQTDEAIGRAVNLINFVGKDVTLGNGKLMVENSQMVTDARVKLDQESVNTKIEVRDGAGVLVASTDIGPLPSGESKLEWHDVGKDGKKLSNGAYTFSVVATDMNNQPIPTSIASTLKVTGVDLHDTGGAFYTQIGKVGVRDVSSIGSTTSSSNAAAKPVAKAPEGVGPNADAVAKLIEAGAASAPAVKASVPNAPVANNPVAKAPTPNAPVAKAPATVDSKEVNKAVNTAPVKEAH
jgi:flagellar hook assembly protein FlgD